MTISETDPHGTGQHTSGAKLDAGKNRMGMVLQGFSRAIERVCDVGTFGANKYSDFGWLSVPDGYERYSDAMLRHYFANYTEGEMDLDTDIEHDAQVAWNALARLEFKVREKYGKRTREGEDAAEEGTVPQCASNFTALQTISAAETP